ncbi:MAG: META domain-containing protein [Anaerolineales bacterium]|nr:META domain-containing protein [Anaerolineales bacterium]
MKKFYNSILLTILISIIFASCATLPEQVIDPLTDTTWKLITYAGTNPLAGKDMTAAFDGEGISGSASCNHYFGSYKLKRDQISIDELGWTEMACLDPEGIMEQEQIIMKMLSESSSFSVQGDRLQITTSSGDFLIFQQLIVID